MVIFGRMRSWVLLLFLLSLVPAGSSVYQAFGDYSEGTTASGISGWYEGSECGTCEISKARGHNDESSFYQNVASSDDWQQSLEKDFSTGLSGEVTVSFWYWETTANHDGNLWVQACDGTYLAGIGTENPQFEWVTDSSTNTNNPGADYQEWTHATMELLLDNGEVTFDFYQENTGASWTTTQSIPSGKDICTIGVGPDDVWYIDEVRVQTCDVSDTDVTLRAPDGSTSEFTSSSFSSRSGTCGTTPEVTESRTHDVGYNYCPQEGDYDAMMEANTQGEDGSYSWETSSYTTGIYNVNYDSSSDWCGCGDQYAGNTYNWLASATDYNDAGYPRCCGDEGSEIWEAAGGGNSACVNGETVSSGGVASNDRSYLTKDGELHWCKVPGGASKPYSWLTEWYECDYVSTSSGEYYCGAGGTDKEGKWYTLQNSGCQLVERIRGGRIIVH